MGPFECIVWPIYGVVFGGQSRKMEVIQRERAQAPMPLLWTGKA
jgi:hypothetical protein